MKISYAITACSEHEELDRLLSLLTKHKREQDEIVVQTDSSNTTDSVIEVIKKYSVNIIHIRFSLNSDFSSFKNNLKKNCTGNWIFQIDADEYVKEEFIYNLPAILEENSNIDMFYMPRINVVTGITNEHIKKWNWKANENGWINFPDYQTRILKNISKINWKNKVHEVLTGYVTYSLFPQMETYCLIHEKTIERQEKQNNFYNNI